MDKVAAYRAGFANGYFEKTASDPITTRKDHPPAVPTFKTGNMLDGVDTDAGKSEFERRMANVGSTDDVINRILDPSGASSKIHNAAIEAAKAQFDPGLADYAMYLGAPTAGAGLAGAGIASALGYNPWVGGGIGAGTGLTAGTIALLAKMGYFG